MKAIPFLVILATLLLYACDNSSSSADRCGDGIEDIGEECDYKAPDISCVTLGYYGGMVSCNTDCTMDLSECETAGRCGDTVLQAGEDCEGGVGGETCASQGFETGTLTCGVDCRYDYSQCVGAEDCGNGTIEGNEECDGANLGGETCSSFGFHGTGLACSECRFDLTECQNNGSCGDGEIQAAFEECDSALLGGATCESVGLAAGTLSCDSETCALDLSGCGGCGNTVCDGDEDYASCPEDCDTCGDGVCDGGENFLNCITDCDTCGDGTCDPGADEDGLNCPADCSCGDGVLSADEVCDGELFRETLLCEDLPGLTGTGQMVCSADCASTSMENCTLLQLDMLFVVDNSMAMDTKQSRFSEALPRLIGELRRTGGGMPNVHIGVTSTDMGTMTYVVGGCSGTGDNGRLLMGADDACSSLATDPYLVDIVPAGCTITRDASDTCIANDCTAANCESAAFDVTEPEGLTLAVDDAGCPRCRNYSGTMTEALTCMTTLGTSGCGFEQPLEAMMAALDNRSGANDGFLRDPSILSVTFITDEDDCSVKNSTFFDPSNTASLGPVSSFRCTSWGISCAETWHLTLNPGEEVQYTGCAPRPESDPLALLHSPDYYINRLEQIRDRAYVFISTFDATTTTTLTTEADGTTGGEALQKGCSDAVPALRLGAFADAFTHEDWEVWNDICMESYSTPMVQLANTLSGQFSLPTPAPMACAIDEAYWDASSSSCPAFTSCIFSGAVTTACEYNELLTEQSSSWQTCTGLYCPKGSLCMTDLLNQDRCFPICNTTEHSTCPTDLWGMTTQCTAMGEPFPTDFGVCLRGDNCEPLDGLSTCGSGEACYYGVGFDTVCSTAGTVAIGGACGAFDDCVPGAACDVDVCTPLCDTSAPGCSASQTCVPFFENATRGFCED